MKLLIIILFFLVFDICPRYNETFPHRSFILVLASEGNGDRPSSRPFSFGVGGVKLKNGGNTNSKAKLFLHSTPNPKEEEEEYLEDLEDEEDYDILDDFTIGSQSKDHTSHFKGHSKGTDDKGLSLPLPPLLGIEKDRSHIQIHKEEKCPEELEGKCHCAHIIDHYDKTKTRYVVNCTNSGFTDDEPLQFIPPQTEILIVRGNHIRSLGTNVFGALLQHPFLREIDFGANGIEEIKGKSFHHVSSVQVLILDYNQISIRTLRDHPRLFSNFEQLKSLHLSGAFQSNENLMEDLKEIFKESNLTQLEKIHLEQNSIGRISDPETFCSLQALQHLYLSGNRLTDLALDLDLCLPSLSYIDLSINQIKTIRKGAPLFTLLQNTTNRRSEPIRIDLHDNPFNCDCALKDYLQWLRDIRIIDPDRIRYINSMRCATGLPANNTHLLLTAVKVTECPTLYAQTNEVIDAVSWTLLLVILGLTTLALFGVLVYKTGGIRYIFSGGSSQSPLLLTAQGVKYTSIKEEVVEPTPV